MEYVEYIYIIQCWWVCSCVMWFPHMLRWLELSGDLQERALSLQFSQRLSPEDSSA